MDLHKIVPERLSERHRGVSSGLATAYAEALSVCLQKYHNSPVEYALRDNANDHAAAVEWELPSESLKAAWGNDIDAVEWAAYGLALAGMELTRGLVAVSRAETRSGADYYLDTPTNDVHDLESAKRLEVSGVGIGSESAIQSRLKRKLMQTARGASDLPAVASVVGFETLLILSADLVEDDLG